MASVLDVDAALVIKNRGAAAVLAGQGGSCKNEIQLGQKFHVQTQLLDVRGCLIAQ